MFHSRPSGTAAELTSQVRQFLSGPDRLVSLRWYALAREIGRAAVCARSRHAHAQSIVSPQEPTPERRQKGDAITTYTATDRAGEYGNQVAAPLLLDRLRDSGGLQGAGEDERASLSRHSAGIFLRTLYHDSGLMRPMCASYRHGGGSGGDPTRPLMCERSHGASNKLARYEAIAQAILKGPRRGEAGSLPQGRRAHLFYVATEVSCWDRGGFSLTDIRAALDLVAAAEGTEYVETEAA